MKSELPSATSESIGVQGKSDDGIGSESLSAGERDQKLAREDEKPHQPARPGNIFSGTFQSEGSKIIQGNQFNSGGGPMSF